MKKTNGFKLEIKDKKEIFSALGLITQIGLSMTACIVIGFFIGRFLDGLFEASPLLLIVFTIIGVLASFRNLYVLTKKYWDNK